MDYRSEIAKRYLVSPRSVSLISKITGISVTGVALGVAALIVVLSVLNGFFDFVRDMLVSFDPHIRIESVSDEGFVQVDSVLRVVDTVEGVTRATPYVEGKALLMHKGTGEVNKVVIVRGIDPSALGTDDGVVSGTVWGSFDLTTREGHPGIVMGESLGQRLLLAPAGGEHDASRVALLSAPGLETMFTRVLGAPPLRQYEVRGLFKLEALYDESHVFIALKEAQRLFRMKGVVSGVDIRLENLEEADATKQVLVGRLDASKFRVQTWYDLQKSLYDVMRLEKWGASLVLILIVVVAVFNIVGSLTMIVIEKRRDVGVLRAMGVSKRNIRRIFLTEGLFIGLIGSGAGLVVGLALALMQKYFEIVPLAGAESFLIDAYPVSIRIPDILGIFFVALMLCVAAASYPAWRAAAIEPAKALGVEG